MAKTKKSADPTKLSPAQVKEITDYIQGRKAEKIDSKTIRKEVFKKFNIDTEQWQLNWEPKPDKVKGTTKNTPVAEGQQLATTHQIVRRKEPVTFKHDFSVDEINDRAKIQAQLEIDREQIENEKKNVMNEFKTKIEEKETQISKLAREINTGFEMRNETCEVVRNFETNTKQVLYKGKLVKEEKMTQADYTLMFPETEEELA